MEMLTVAPDELAAMIETAATQNYYCRNMETGKLELHFEKSAYDALTDDQKRDIKSNFLWGRNSGCWISRAMFPNLYRAERCAASLGLTNAGKTGERATFADMQDRKAEKATHRAERMEIRADAAADRAETLQKPIKDHHGDIAFFTQPNINTSAGRAFTRSRERMFAAFENGFKEYRKSEYYRERAQVARRAADHAELKSAGFVQRRIDECCANIRSLKRTMEKRGADDRLDEMMEMELDKLGYYQEALESLGGVSFGQENVKPGNIVRVERFGSVRVISCGPKNFVAESERALGCGLKYSYAEILEMVDSSATLPMHHPWKVGDTLDIWTVEKVTPSTVTVTDGKTSRRLTPRYSPIPALGKWCWVLYIGYHQFIHDAE